MTYKEFESEWSKLLPRLISDYSRVIELRPARILMGPEDLPHGVAEPGASASSPASRVARVLVEKRGDDPSVM